MIVIEKGVGREVSTAQLSYDWYRLDGTLNSGKLTDWLDMSQYMYLLYQYSECACDVL